MESVLEVYKRPSDKDYPVICMDETSVQCTKEVREPIKACPGQAERYDAEYECKWCCTSDDTLVMDNLNTHTRITLQSIQTRSGKGFVG